MNNILVETKKKIEAIQKYINEGLVECDVPVSSACQVGTRVKN